MGQNVPPDAEEQLPTVLSLFHAEEREEEGWRNGAHKPAERSLEPGG